MRVHPYRIAGQPVEIRVVETAEDLAQFDAWCTAKAEAGAVVGFDTETSGLDVFSPGYRLRLCQFGDLTTAWVLPVEYGGPFAAAARKWLLRLPQLTIHNAPFDWQVCDAHLGVSLEDLYPRTVDTKILATLVDPRQPQEGGIGTGLKPLSAHWIDPGAPDTQGDLTATFRALKLTKANGWGRIPLTHPTYELYAGLDVILGSWLLEVMRRVHRDLDIRPKLVEYEHRLAFICAVMQRRGMVLDVEYVRQLDEQLLVEAEQFALQAARFGVDNINSTTQVADALVAMGEKLSDRTAGGQLRVDKAVLLALADRDLSWDRLHLRKPNPLAEAVVRAKRASKWRTAYASTFLETMDVRGRVHPDIRHQQARTGRMSISRPALQTLPSGDWTIRRALLAEPGDVVVAVDFTAVEMRVLAALADVRKMRAAIEAGADLHDYTAQLVYGPGFTRDHRRLAKGVGLATIYGGGAETIHRQTGAPLDEIQYARKTYGRVYPEIKRASNAWQREAFANNMVLVSPVGRRLPLDRDRTYAAVNYMCQSTARDLLGQALINIQDAGALDLLRLPIHDEVVLSAPKAEAEEVRRTVERAMTMELFGVRIDAKGKVGGRSWGTLYGAAA
ncbi:DNA polymerase [Kitasatospora sp. MBT66]|uniref:DNA polymerase n=1 Tax=Kitasatospora sp. MBT66 TaxID=1444769 RepID=UPI0005BB0616|nr:DNA polymerase [Kitasatospora sp. MBT66]